jgi:hypothetical protein
MKETNYIWVIMEEQKYKQKKNGNNSCIHELNELIIPEPP